MPVIQDFKLSACHNNHTYKVNHVSLVPAFQLYKPHVRYKIMYVTTLIILFIFQLGSTSAQNGDVDCWESQDIRNHRIDVLEETSSFLSPVTQLFIGVYQKNASATSIERCPFHFSCSRFAASSVNRYGLFGICMFIDRYFFREHSGVQLYYPLITNVNGVLKLDDHDFHTLFE